MRLWILRFIALVFINIFLVFTERKISLKKRTIYIKILILLYEKSDGDIFIPTFIFIDYYYFVRDTSPFAIFYSFFFQIIPYYQNVFLCKSTENKQDKDILERVVEYKKRKVERINIKINLMQYNYLVSSGFLFRGWWKKLINYLNLGGVCSILFCFDNFVWLILK